MQQKFGGGWTDEKLELLRKYLVPYATIMRKQNFRFAYIDAFAGTGYREVRQTRESGEPLFPELAEAESQRFLAGSARVALEVVPEFDKYIFIEQDPERFGELAKLKDEYPQKADRIELLNADANAWLVDRCLNHKWKRHRAVVFLDPFGMQVVWETVTAIAKTKAIDLLVLFPLGVAANRLLTRDRRIPASWQQRLDNLFGTHGWYDDFYRTETDLLGYERSVKVINLEGIGRYYIKQLETLFPNVVERPRPLYNSRGNPLYLLCFASFNRTATRIATDIFSKK